VPPRAVADAGPAGSLVYPTNTGVNYAVNTSARNQIVATGLTAPGTGDFTYEAWFKTTLPQGSVANPLTLYPNQTILGTRSASGGGNAAIDVTVRNGALNVTTGLGGFPVTTASYTIVENQWYHFAYVRKNVSGVKTTSLYLNGNLVSTNANGVGSRTDFTASQTSTQATIGTKGQQCCANDSSEAFQGYLSNIRISNFAEYSSNFTPSGPLTPTANTQILLNTTNDANKIKNSAGNAIIFAITGVGSAAEPASSSTSPFASPTVASLSVISGTLGGGTSTTVTGTNLSSTSGITVGGTSATGVVVNSSTSVSFVTPSGTLGAKDVVVSTMLGNFTLSGAFTYALTTQAITFPGLSSITLGDAAPTLSATASSNLTVSYISATTSVCTVTGTTITVLTMGTCTINANQAGNGTYAAAAQVQKSFVISPVPVVDDGAALAAAAAAAAKRAAEQKELTELLALIPEIAKLSLELGETTKSLYQQKCVKGKHVKYVKNGAKCPKGYVAFKKSKPMGS